MAAVSAPYAKYPPPPPLRPPGGKGKRVGFKPPPPPAQTPSSLSVSASRAPHRRDRRPCDPPGQRTALTETGPAPTSGGPRCSPAAPRRHPAPDRPSASQWSSLSAGAAGRPPARPPLPSRRAPERSFKSPLPSNRALPLPSPLAGVSRAGPRCHLPAPPLPLPGPSGRNRTGPPQF